MTDDFGIPKGPNSDFWFGADAAGRDLFVRTMYGARTSLLVGIVASGLAVAHRHHHRPARRVLRALDRHDAVARSGRHARRPQLLISIGIVAPCSTTKEGCLHGLIKPGLSIVIAVIVLFSWPYTARVIRGNTLSLKQKEFVEASRSPGAGNLDHRRRHRAEPRSADHRPRDTADPQRHPLRAALSYLGLGVAPDRASWGRSSPMPRALRRSMVAHGVPGTFLVITTLAFNLLGDGLRDALDVHRSLMCAAAPDSSRRPTGHAG